MTRRACCAPRSGAKTRCCSSSTSTSTARATTAIRCRPPTGCCPFGQRRLRAPRRARHRRHVGRDGAPQPSRPRSSSATTPASRSSTCARSHRGTATSSRSRCARPDACSSCTRTRSPRGFGAEVAAFVGRRLLRVPRRAGVAARGNRHACRLRAHARERDPPADRRHRPRPRSPPQVLTLRRSRRCVDSP